MDGWAIRHSYHNRDLADFTAYSESILRRAAIRDAIRDLNRHIEGGAGGCENGGLGGSDKCGDSWV